MKRIGIPALVLVAVVAAGCQRNDRRDTAAGTGGSTAVGTSGSTDLSRADRDFIQDVAIANMAEIELGRLASERATIPDVKKYGQMMVDDHTAAGEKLKSVTSKHSITLPTALDDKHRDMREKLAQKQGADFDRDYVDTMVDQHDDLLDKLASRVDKEKLSEWRTKHEDVDANRRELANRKTEETGQTTAITPERSDNPVTMAINQWAAETYPTVFKHLQMAKSIQNTIKNRTTP